MERKRKVHTNGCLTIIEYEEVLKILIQRDNGEMVEAEDATNEELLEALRQINAELKKKLNS